MAPCEITQACNAGATPQSAYEYLMRKLVVNCQMKQQLDAMGNHGIQEEDIRDFHNACNEVRDIGKCLTAMIHTIKDPSTSHDAIFKDLQHMAEVMENEERVAKLNKRQHPDAGAIIVQTFKGYLGALWQQYATIGLATDFEQSSNVHIGPLTFDLWPKEELDSFDACMARIKGLREQQQRTMQLDGEQAAPSASEQQAPSATFSAQLQKLDEQVDQYGISRAAAYKKAIQITLEKQGKTAAVERQVPAQVKAFIDRTGQDAQVFEHAKATPIAHEIIQDAYQNIEKLHEGLMMAPGMNLPEAQMDLVFTAVNLSVAAADAAQKGNCEQALAAEHLAYATRCASEFMRCGAQSGLDAINPATYAKVIASGVQAEMRRDEQAHFANMSIVSAIAKQLGLLKPETIQVMDQACARYEQQQQLVAQELSKAMRADIANMFKDGVVLGLSRIGGHTLGSFLGPITVEVGMAKAAGTLAKIRGLRTLTFTEIEQINVARILKQQELQTELAQAEKLLQEATGQGRVHVTPEGFKIPVGRDGEFVAEPFVAAMEGETKKAGAIAEAVTGKSVITGYTETAVDYKHIFSSKHIERGIMKLSKLANEGAAKNEIVRVFQSIVKDVDSHGLLKPGGTNIIRTVINGLETEIKFDILPDGTIRSFDGYIGRTGRNTWFNMITWDYKGM